MMHTQELSIEEKKGLAKRCIDEGYSVSWSHLNNTMQVYIAGEYVRSFGWTPEIKAHIALGRDSNSKVRVDELTIYHQGIEGPLLIDSGDGFDERLLGNLGVKGNSNVRKLYNDVMRIFS